MDRVRSGRSAWLRCWAPAWRSPGCSRSGYHATSWLSWTVLALRGRRAGAGSAPRRWPRCPASAPGRSSASVLMSAWLFAMAAGATRWLAWLSFGFGFAFVVLSIAFTAASSELDILHRHGPHQRTPARSRLARSSAARAGIAAAGPRLRRLRPARHHRPRLRTVAPAAPPAAGRAASRRQRPSPSPAVSLPAGRRFAVALRAPSARPCPAASAFRSSP